MTDLLNGLVDVPLPAWAWFLSFLGVVALVGVIGALFLPDWASPAFHSSFEAAPGSSEFAMGVAAFLDSPVVRGGTVELLQNGDAFYPRMLADLRAARRTIHFQVYIFEPDEIGRQFIELFEQKAREGVKVRLLVDAFGALKLKKKWREQMEAAGVDVQLFRPLDHRNLPRIFKRTHRRAIVVDDRVAYTGGAAVSKKWAGDVRTKHEWRDSMTRVTGPMVATVQTAFTNNWVYCTGELVTGSCFYPLDGPGDLPMTPSGGGEGRGAEPCAIGVVSSPADSAQPIRMLFWLSFCNARRRLWLCNSYFIPDENIRAVVKDRARAGVDVRILVPGDHTDAVPVQAAGRAFYEELLEAGVRIYEFQPSMMHAKTAVVDGVWSVVGSANLDERSMELNEENVIAVEDAAFARSVEEGLERDFARSKEIDREEWKRRGWRQRAMERCCMLLIEQY